MNLIFVTLDGLRADRLGPNMKTLFRDNLYFTNIITAAPYTIASMHAIFSGIYPSRNGVDSYFNMFRYKDSCKTMAQYMKDDGYYCVADAFNINGLPKAGFDKLFIHDEKGDILERHKKLIAEEVANSNGKFFLYLHNTMVHKHVIDNVAKKYDDFSDEYFDNKQKFSEAYDSYVPEYDGYVKGLMEYLDSSGLLSNTLVVFHTDHGCSVGDKKGERMYGVFTYDYTVKTFASFIFPEGKYKGVIDYQCSTVDILPTILDVMGISSDTSFDKLDGNSLILYVSGEEKKDRVVYSETGGLFGPWPSHKEHNVFCVRFNGKKLIYNKTPKTWEFYDLISDPEENNDLYSAGGDVVEEYKKMLTDWLVTNGKGL